ncbi:MAG: hypothetical protein ACSHW1_08295 [Yoonia sp.]|uniref:hypothetical protein n=1 Tax=Yoonia sp. TaxID=2212373 RepID=UPI003EF7B0E0
MMEEQEVVARLDLPLVGKRAYVRATDIVCDMALKFPDQRIRFGFRRPLRGPAEVYSGDHGRSAVNVTLENGDRFSVVPTKDRASRRELRDPPFRSRYFRIGTYYFLFTSEGGTDMDRIDYVYDLVHPAMQHKLLIAEFEYFNVQAAPRFMWTQIKFHKRESRITVRCLKGRIASSLFLVRRQRPTG